jgi:DNA-binding beta-propeller fold protein YncE
LEAGVLPEDTADPGFTHSSGDCQETEVLRILVLSGLALLLAAPSAHSVLPPDETSHFYVSSYEGDEVAVYRGSGAYMRSFTAPGLEEPRGIVFVPDGRIYVASEGTHEVYVFDSNEQYLTQFGHPEMIRPTGMALVDGDELHVCSYGANQVVVFDLDGKYQETYTWAGLSGPNCIAVDNSGHRFVTAGISSIIVEFDKKNDFFAAFNGGGLSSPMGLAFNPRGDTLYVAGGGSHNIVLYDKLGIFLGTLAHPDLTGPQGVAFDDRGHLFSTSFYKNQIVEFDRAGSYVQTITDGSLVVPRSTAFRPWENVISAPLLAGGFSLYQNAPNPMTDDTVIRFAVPDGGEQVSLQIYDARGRLVRTLVDGWQPAGVAAVSWDGRDRAGAAVPAGAYFYRLQSGGAGETRKLTVVD